MGQAYYNECDPAAAEWLRELIRHGHIAAGVVDERSILDVKPDDLINFTQCHFFAGIGGWSYALRLAGWPDSRPVWTGSCPCQPFSAAGKGLGVADERHLWPVFSSLIQSRRPSAIFGEQVASPASLGWLDGVFDDLEKAGYACGANDLCAAGVGSPQIRQRNFWVASTDGGFASDFDLQRSRQHGQQQENGCPLGGVGCADGERLSERAKPNSDSQTGFETPHRPNSLRSGPWVEYDTVVCTDGKTRRIEPGTFPLAHGVPARVGRLRGYGNAINPYVAAEFIQAYLEAAA